MYPQASRPRMRDSSSQKTIMSVWSVRCTYFDAHPPRLLRSFYQRDLVVADSSANLAGSMMMQPVYSYCRLGDVRRKHVGTVPARADQSTRVRRLDE